MRIGEAAERSGLGVDTIRYYEKVGVLPPVPRDAQGQRNISGELLDLMILLHLLRETGMPMARMKHFAGLYRQGTETIPDRRAVLLDHGERLRARRADVDRCEALLAKKLRFYDDMERKV